jgi:hypothetical protein
MSDYGAPKKAKNKSRTIGVIAIAALIAAGSVGFLIFADRDSTNRAVEKASAASGAVGISGPACAAGTPQGKLGRGDEWMMHEFNDNQFGRRIGHVDCALAAAGGGKFDAVCQFSSPAELKVVTKTGETYFDIGLGQPATVTVKADNTVSCVMASNAF